MIKNINTITIPTDLLLEKDLIILPRKEYETILNYLKITGEYENLWINASKNKFLKSYHKSDTIYDQV
ncbi:hypothetical protein HY061_01065 [Candidatus Azambacteria bacterium]|nr:hypothetical protein [Candidatus Azambacteria bacterium]